MVATTIHNNMVGRVGNQLLQCGNEFRGGLSIFRSCLERRQRSVIIQQDKPLLSLVIFHFDGTNNTGGYPFLTKLFILTARIAPFTYKVCRPLINRLYGNNFLHVLQAFQLFLFGHLQSPTNGLLYLLSVIGVNQQCIRHLNSCTCHFTQNQNTRIIIFRGYIFLWQPNSCHHEVELPKLHQLYSTLPPVLQMKNRDRNSKPESSPS